MSTITTSIVYHFMQIINLFLCFFLQFEYTQLFLSFTLVPSSIVITFSFCLIMNFLFSNNGYRKLVFLLFDISHKRQFISTVLLLSFLYNTFPFLQILTDVGKCLKTFASFFSCPDFNYDICELEYSTKLERPTK